MAFAALQLMFSYACSTNEDPLPIMTDRFVARIGERNEASIALYKKLGFEVTRHVSAFEEIELRIRGTARIEWGTGELRTLVTA